MQKFAGVDVGGTKFATLILDKEGKIYEKRASTHQHKYS